MPARNERTFILNMFRPGPLSGPLAAAHRLERFPKGADQIIDRPFSLGIPVSHENMDVDLLDSPPPLFRDPGQERGHGGEAGGPGNHNPLFGKGGRNQLVGFPKVCHIISKIGVVKALFQRDLQREQGEKPKRTGAMKESVRPLSERSDLFFSMDISPEGNDRGAERTGEVDRLLLLSADDPNLDVRKGRKAVENAAAENAGCAEENEPVRGAAHRRLPLKRDERSMDFRPSHVDSVNHGAESVHSNSVSSYRPFNEPGPK